MSTKSKIRSNSSTSADCVLCCEPITLYAVGPCDHPTCYKCSSRMRVLINQKYCAICRADVPMVIFSSELKTYDVLKSTKQKKLVNSKHGIQFLSSSARQKFDNLLVYQCNLCTPNLDLPSFDKLRSHMRKEHNQQYCNICVEKLHVFPAEYRTYSQKELIVHRKTGDSDNSSFRGHPECRFCNDRFLDNDELLNHLRKHHFWCHFCERDGRQDYYDSYPHLREHFRTSHFLCEEENCRTEEYTAVFRHQLDLQAHIVERHPYGLSKQEAKKQRNVNVDLGYLSRRSRPHTPDDLSQQNRRTNNPTVSNSLQEQGAASLPPSRKEVGGTQPSDLEKVYGVEAKTKPNGNNENEIPVIVSNNGPTRETDFPSLGSATSSSSSASWTSSDDPSVKKKTNKSETRSPNLGRTWNKAMPDVQDSEAFPGLPTKQKKNKQNARGKKKSNTSIQPQTPSNAPPGLSRSSNKPPGFAAVAGSSPKHTAKSSSEPPGFAAIANPLQSSSTRPGSKNVVSAQIPSATFRGMQPTEKASTETKPNPDESNKRERNARLIQMFQTYLRNDQLLYFRELSAHFRKAEIPSQLYYEEICLLFGNNLNKIFSELVALLPDAEKQEELLELHMARKALLKQQEDSAPVASNVNSYRDMCKQQEVEQKIEKPEPSLNKKSAPPATGNDFPALPASNNNRRHYKPYRTPTHVHMPNAWGSK